VSPILEQAHDLGAFRTAIRSWLQETCPPPAEAGELADDAAMERVQRNWMVQLGKVGLATPHWPVDAGGAGLGLRHQIIIADEMARAVAPRQTMYVVSLNQVPATLLAWGTREQKERYLPGVAEGVMWCQGFSEPGSGSDLASLRTLARREGGDYIVNGQKVWSSYSMYAQYCILLARTDPDARKHSGLSCFIMEMKSPGVEVRPIRQSTGRADFAELFLQDVRIPVANRIGPENQGWAVGQTTLASERGVLAFEHAERLRYQMERFYGNALKTNASWLSDDQLRREFMRFVTQLQALRGLIRELLEHNDKIPQSPTVAPSVIKFVRSTLAQRFAAFATLVGGPRAQFMKPAADGAGPATAHALHDFIESYGSTIAGGTNEIQLNIISERGLGMPRG
jgi:alkylation response protein AidB-like acyl-CoA dehydrogenase